MEKLEDQIEVGVQNGRVQALCGELFPPAGVWGNLVPFPHDVSTKLHPSPPAGSLGNGFLGENIVVPNQI